MFIKSITIKNFRSIREEKISLEGLNVFSGQNDAGKSNVLKALNLFFNGQTGFQEDFSFKHDLSLYHQTPQKKAQEISITLEIDPPASYRSKERISWTKRWREVGLSDNIILYDDKEEPPPYSKLPTWLQRIQYVYVPAVKGNDYFQELLGQLHDTLTATVEDKIKHAAGSFTESINKHVHPILLDIQKKLSIESSIALPNDLRNLFADLDFKSKQGEISINHRGDGIKTRHIPIILHFIAEQRNSNRTMGSVNYSTLWGYEEPENSVEMSLCFAMAKEFLEYSNEGIQLFLTTHSPAFYMLGEKQGAKLYRVSGVSDQPSKIELVERQNIAAMDEEMGLMPVVAPHIAKIKEGYDELQVRVREMEANQVFKHPTLFVEGLTDKIVLEKSLKLFAPEASGKIRVESKSSAGVEYVKNKLLT